MRRIRDTIYRRLRPHLPRFGRIRKLNVAIAFLFLLWLITILSRKSNQSDKDDITEIQNSETEIPSTYTVHNIQQLYNNQGRNRTKNSIKTKEPHEIMTKLYDVPYGVFDGAPYKKILYWSYGLMPSAYPEKFGLGVGRDVYKKAGCPVWQCETSTDRSNLTDYDALLFNYLTMKTDDLPKDRSPHQRYILFDYESPVFGIHKNHGENLRGVTRNFFNWTMHYRWDSDVVHPYAWIQPKGSVPLHPEEDVMKQLKTHSQSVNHATGKTKMAAWMASKCDSHSGRKVLIDQLIEYGVQIDIYGSCGNLTCGINNYHYNDYKTDDTDEPCRQMIGKTYKFYFSLENALCLDYVTEKFYAMMRYPVIPVVMDAHGNHARAAPPHSYINALDFPTVRQLADYLIELDRNDHLYNEYFWWKEHFTVRNSLLSGMFYKNFCSLCAALHNPPAQSVQKVYKDVIAWWIDDAQCQKPKFG